MAEAEDTQSDYCDEDEAEEDDEATLDEDEDELNEDYDSELKELQAENEMSIEELQRKYYGDPNLEDENDSQGEGENAATIDEDQLLAQPSSSSSSNRLAGSLRGKIFGTIATGCESLTQTLGTYFKPEDLEEDDTEDYIPPELWKKEIRVGPEYQVAELPKLHMGAQSTSADPSNECTSEVLWMPSPERCPEQRVISYLLECEQIRAGEKQPAKNGPANRRRSDKSSNVILASGLVPDDENALLALLQENYDVKRAKAKAPFDWPSLKSVNAPRCTWPPGPWRQWSDEDCSAFERGMLEHGKHFWKIRRDFLEDRTIGEMVAFYYRWKKSERHDIWIQEKCKREQQLEVKTTDLMGQIANSIMHGKNAEESGEGGKNGTSDSRVQKGEEKDPVPNGMATKKEQL